MRGIDPKLEIWMRMTADRGEMAANLAEPVV
jgi:hypothetical protein